MAIEARHVDPSNTEPVSFPYSNVVFDAYKEGLITREERIIDYYAQRLNEGNMDALSLRYRASEYNTDNPYEDTLVSDPLSDPRVINRATFLRHLEGKDSQEAINPNSLLAYFPWMDDEVF